MRKRIKRRQRKVTKRDTKMADMLAATLIPTLYKLLHAYPLGSRKHQTCLNVLNLMSQTWPPQQPVIPQSILALAKFASNHAK